MSQRDIDVVILGAGFGGLGMAATLLKNDIHNFVIFEQGPSLGGVWRDNIYPGAACDVDAVLYCYSYFPNLQVTCSFSGQEEILDYMHRFSDEFGLDNHIELNKKITAAQWLEHENKWELTINHAEKVKARVFITAWGQLNVPSIPNFEGLNQFQGVQFHSAQWPEQIDLSGKKVLTVGTAASAVQYIPEIAPIVDQLYIFQRTPNWVVPRKQRYYTKEEREQFQKHPEIFFSMRQANYNERETATFARLQKGSIEHEQAIEVALTHLKDQIKDEELQRKLIPDYDFGCRRVLRSDDYYPTLNRKNVELVLTEIDHITPTGVVAKNGQHYEVDVLIFGTGFATQHFNGDLDVKGLRRASLTERWQAGAEAYLGLTVPDFPNFFMLYGPNTNLNHNSILAMLEIQHDYVAAAIKHILNDNLTIDVKKDVFKEFNLNLQKELAESVFSAGCSSWYQNSEGKVVNNWSSTVADYGAITQFNESDFYVSRFA